MKKLLLFFLIAVTFFGCSARKYMTDSVNQLFNKEWKLVKINGKTVRTTKAFIVFSPHQRVNGNLGCNNFSGNFGTNGKTLKLTQLVSTRMMCIDSMKIEDGFTAALNKIDNFKIKNGELLLKQGKKTLAVLSDEK